MHSITKFPRLVAASVALGLLVLSATSCGGAAGGAQGAGQGLVLLSFLQDGVDNAVLNTRLEFRFSEAVDLTTVGPHSIQIREGDAFGATVPGTFYVTGSSVMFEPRLASLCDESDSGLKSGMQYRVQCIGHPEEFSLRSLAGQALAETVTLEFQTRSETDPPQYLDQIPAAAPVVTSTSPLDQEQAVAVTQGNEVVIDISENLDPCSVGPDTVLFCIFETGDPAVQADAGNGRVSGFSHDGTNTGDTSDQAPEDPFTWGAGGAIEQFSPPQVIPARITLEQDFHMTRIRCAPLFRQFPENALIVVELTFDIRDYGDMSLAPHRFSFTTENLTLQNSSYAMEVEGETPWNLEDSTADIDSPRSPGCVQGYMLFSGDGDNGDDLLRPTLPQSNPPLCTMDYQVNAGGKDDFDPIGPEVLLDTGGTPNGCPNSVDGSTAVVWEFLSFRIRSGVTVRVIGVNPAIFLVQGDIQIDSGGRLSVRADGQGGSPRGNGQNGFAWTSNPSGQAFGGTGVAGAGDGGDGIKHASGTYGGDGYSAFGSADGFNVKSGESAGLGGVCHNSVYPGPSSGSAQGGGGGGHGEPGEDGPNVLGPNHSSQGPPRGNGGAAIPTGSNAEAMSTPSAGGGGGAGGNDRWSGSYTSYGTGGGAGGAGGGFVDLTSSGDIVISGTIDAAGSRGGNSGSPYTGTNPSGGGGGGGGAGGGIRLLTPNEIVLAPGALLSAAGGAGGSAPSAPVGQNNGGNGGNGRIVMEDGDSIIAGLGTAEVTPGEGDEGFYRSAFDATRFKGGGLRPMALSEPFPVGPLNPTFLEPVQSYGSQEDFVAGVPTLAAPGTGKTAILIEARGYQIAPNGGPDMSTVTDWFSIGHFIDTGIANLPEWRSGHPSTNPLDADYVAVPADNALHPASPMGNSGDRFAALNAAGTTGFEYLQLRICMFLPTTVGPFDGGAYIDLWNIRFTHDQ